MGKAICMPKKMKIIFKTSKTQKQKKQAKPYSSKTFKLNDNSIEETTQANH